MVMQQFILMPSEGAQPRAQGREAGALLRTLPRSVSTQPPVMSCTSLLTGDATREPMRLLDAVRENGCRLVEMEPRVAAAVTASAAPVCLKPLATYALPVKVAEPGQLASAPRLLTSLLPATVTIVCRDARTGAALPGSKVVAYTDFANRDGRQGLTDAAGAVTLKLKCGGIEQLFVEAAEGYWGAYRADIEVSNGEVLEVAIAPVDLAQPDAVRLYYGATRYNAASGVKVAVIDTGIGPHPQLNVEHLENTVTGEPKSEGLDWRGHGTHVAGLVGAKGGAGGLRGMAPGVPLRGYRVFGQGAEEATNYAILKAIINAVDDGCDIINLSLGGDEADPVVAEGIRDARAQGVLVVVAAGNGGRGPVDYPAAFAGATAVAAMGVNNGFPADCFDTCHVLRPPQSRDYPDEFIAGFSDYGNRVSVVAPGVGLLSTLPGGGFGPMSGTSMASPVVAGAAACLLSQAPAIYGLNRDQARSDQIEKLLLTACRSRGFPAEYEGFGMPDPRLV